MSLRSFLTGADNETLAIGRVIGVALFALFLAFLPGAVAIVLLMKHVEPLVWFTYLGALQVYVPLMIGAIVGVVSGTAFTEPKPKTLPPN